MWLRERRVRIPIMSHSFSVLPTIPADTIFIYAEKTSAYTVSYCMPKSVDCQSEDGDVRQCKLVKDGGGNPALVEQTKYSI